MMGTVLGWEQTVVWRSMAGRPWSVTVIVVIRYFVRRWRMTGRAETVFTVSMDKMQSMAVQEKMISLRNGEEGCFIPLAEVGAAIDAGNVDVLQLQVLRVFKVVLVITSSDNHDGDKGRWSPDPGCPEKRRRDPKRAFHQP